jgi:anti-sigma B factor antagonist
LEETRYARGDPRMVSPTGAWGASHRPPKSVISNMMKAAVEHQDGATILAIEGTLDASNASELRPIVDKLVEEKRTAIVVQVSGLRLIDSSGVGVLVGLLKRTKAQGGTVRLEGLKDQPLAIFKLLRLDKVFSP